MKSPARKNFTFIDHHAQNVRSDYLRQKKQAQWIKFLKYGLLFVLLIISLKIIASVPGFINSLRQPFPTAQSEFLNRQTPNFASSTNLLLASLKDEELIELAVASIFKEDNRAVVLFLSPQTKVYVQEGETSFGELVKNENNLAGLDRLAAKLTEELGLNLDGYLVTLGGEKWVQEEKIKEISAQVFSVDFFFQLNNTKSYLNKNLRTNLTSGNLLALLNFVKGAKEDTINYFALQQVLDEAGFLNKDEVANQLGLSLVDNRISEEGATVEIVNASGVSGMEIVAKRVLTTMGANVLRIGEETSTEKSTVFAMEKNELSKKLEGIFGVAAESLPNENGSVDIRVIIGEDYAKFFNF